MHCLYQHLVPKIANYWSKSTLPSTMQSFGASSIFSGLVITQLFPSPATKKCYEKTPICKCQENHCKSDKSADRGTEKWFPGILPETLQMLAKYATTQVNCFEGNVV
jgi:hypothetical protein